MSIRQTACLLLLALLLEGSRSTTAQSEVTARVSPSASASQATSSRPRTAVFWLSPLSADLQQQLAWKPGEAYRLLQKNKMFSPHLLVVPVGATVSFPNSDPFFHNVFSLFNGRRFDLGLYEAGSSRDVRFAQSGISYIFCNIHPEMGAVVVALTTSLWTSGDARHGLRIGEVPPGDYEAHLWLEGEDDRKLAQWAHTLHVRDHGRVDAGMFETHGTASTSTDHLNKFGQPYRRDPAPY